MMIVGGVALLLGLVSVGLHGAVNHAFTIGTKGLCDYADPEATDSLASDNQCDAYGTKYTAAGALAKFDEGLSGRNAYVLYQNGEIAFGVFGATALMVAGAACVLSEKFNFTDVAMCLLWVALIINLVGFGLACEGIAGCPEGHGLAFTAKYTAAVTDRASGMAFYSANAPHYAPGCSAGCVSSVYDALTGYGEAQTEANEMCGSGSMMNSCVAFQIINTLFATAAVVFFSCVQGAKVGKKTAPQEPPA